MSLLALRKTDAGSKTIKLSVLCVAVHIATCLCWLVHVTCTRVHLSWSAVCCVLLLVQGGVPPPIRLLVDIMDAQLGECAALSGSALELYCEVRRQGWPGWAKAAWQWIKLLAVVCNATWQYVFACLVVMP